MRLRQEAYLGEPWKVLVICSLLNKTSGKQAEPVIEALFNRYPDVRSLAAANVRDVEEMVSSLGIKSRASAIVKMAWEYCKSNPLQSAAGAENVEKFPGCGEYARQAWEMLVEGRRDFWPKDSKLCMRMIEMRLNPKPELDRQGHTYLFLTADEKFAYMVGLDSISTGELAECIGEDGKKKLRKDLIAGGPSEEQKRVLLRVPKDQHDKYFRELEDLGHLLETWLNSKYIPLSEGAREVVMSIYLALKDNKVVGKFENSQLALKASPTGSELLEVKDNLGEMTITALTEIYNAVVGEERKIKHFRDKEEAIERTSKALGEIKTEVRMKKQEAVQPKEKHPHVRQGKTFTPKEDVKHLIPFKEGSKLAKLVLALKETNPELRTPEKLMEASNLKKDPMFYSMTGTLTKHGYTTQRRIDEATQVETWAIISELPQAPPKGEASQSA